MRRLRRSRFERPKAAVDMNSLIDLTFLLLVVFIVTLPALEQGVSVMLPQGKTSQLPTKEKKANVITIDSDNHIFLNEKPVTLEELETQLAAMAAADPDMPLWIRGDERIGYGSAMDVVKLANKLKIHRMALVTVEK